MADIEQTNLTALTVDLLSAYFANNTVDSAELSGLIRSTHEALKGIDTAAPEAPPEPEFKPAVSVRASLASKDHIISLIDGKPYKMLRRHLSTNGLTPAEYRERYKLPRDYPMVAPTYSQARRDVAARLGLGRKPQTAAPLETPTETPVADAAPPAPKAKAAPKTKRTPKGVTAPKRTTPRKTKASAAQAAPTSIEAPVAADVPAPKKRGPKPKIAPTTPVEAPVEKAVVKRVPRKSKAAPEPSAS